MGIDARGGGFAIPLLAVATSINKAKEQRRAKTKANAGASAALDLVEACMEMIIYL